MIPNLLNSNYDKELRPEPGLEEADRDFLLKENHQSYILP